MIIEHVKKEFARRTKRNPRYSIRAFARSLGMDSSTLSALLNGRRAVTVHYARKLMSGLELDPPARRKLLLATFGKDCAPGPATGDFTPLEQATLDVISNWEYFAILSCLDTRSPRPHTTASIARKLGLEITHTNRALDTLGSLGLVRNETGAWIRTHKHLTTTHDIPSAALRKAHRQYIEKAMHSLEHHEVTERDITGITMAICPSKLAAAKERIKEFRRELCEFLEGGEPTEVYRLNIQLFPLKGG